MTGARGQQYTIGVAELCSNASKRRARRPPRRLDAWQQWWQHRAQSTFGAVLERDGLLERRSPSVRLRRNSTPPPGGRACTALVGRGLHVGGGELSVTST